MWSEATASAVCAGRSKRCYQAKHTCLVYRSTDITTAALFNHCQTWQSDECALDSFVSLSSWPSGNPSALIHSPPLRTDPFRSLRRPLRIASLTQYRPTDITHIDDA